MPPARRISLTSRWVMGRCWASALSGSAAPMARATVKNIRTGRGNDRELCMVSSGDGWMIFILSDGARYREMCSKRAPASRAMRCLCPASGVRSGIPLSSR